MEQIQNYPIIPIGRSKNLIGQQFGDFQVLYRTAPPKDIVSQEAHWLCQCIKCQQYKVKTGTALKKGLNQCDCETNMINKHFGRWTVLYECDQRTKKRSKIYHCKCECGNEKDVDGYLLRSGQSKSCGCLNRELAAERCRQTRLDITGQRFGKLIAIKPIYSGDRNKHTKWLCHCDCGNEIEVDLGNLRQGFTKSCGCTQSRQEEHIIKLLTQNSINFQYQYRFEDFNSKEFDFYINNQYIIEYDGQQHFKYTGTGWDTEEHFNRTHKSDLLKNKYCFEHNIPIIRIPYDMKYDLNDLKLETTRFLLTSENEQSYYDRYKD